MVARPSRPRALEASSYCRDVLQKAANPGAAHKASSTRCQRGSEAAWRRGCDGIEPPVHGHARRTENWCNDDNKLHARMYAIERQNQERVLVTSESKLEWSERV